MPDVTKRELLLAKDIRKKVKNIPVRSNKKGVKFKTVQEFVNSFPKSHFFIHQHLPRGRATAGRALVSILDFVRLSDLMRAEKAKTGVLTTVNREGEVVGYSVYRLNKPLPKGAGLILEMELATDVRDGRVSKNDASQYNGIIAEYIKRFEIDLKQRFVAMPGYRYNEKSGRFLKIRRQKK